jgi:DNA-directed RNA polymerase subunit F
MGAVFRPKDLGMGYKKIIENAIKDLSPDTKDNVIELFKSWDDTSSKEKLKDIMGPDKAEQLLKKISTKKETGLTDEDRKVLSDILKDSLTFD